MKPGERRPAWGTWAAAALLLGLGALCPRARAQGFAVLRTVPTRIFTPNGDGINDVFYVCFDDPDDSPITSAKIYDLTGAEVADLAKAPAAAPCGGQDALKWDGRQDGGGYARGGIYLYRIRVDRSVFTGSIVLAR